MGIFRSVIKSFIKYGYYKAGQQDGEEGNDVSMLPHYADKLSSAREDPLLDEGERESFYMAGHAQGQTNRITKIEEAINNKCNEEISNEDVTIDIDNEEYQSTNYYDQHRKIDVCEDCEGDCDDCVCHHCRDTDCEVCSCLDCGDDCQDCDCYGCDNDCNYCE